MKLVVLHGNNIVECSQRLQRYINVAKKRGWDIERTSSSKRDVSEVLVAKSIFKNKRFVIIDDINEISKKQLQWIKKNASNIDANVVIYHRNTITKSVIKLLPKPTKIEEYKIPVLIWSFLDSFYPGNAVNCLKLLHRVKADESIELIFFLLSRHLRDLFWVKLESSKPDIPFWRFSKLKSQASKFNKDNLKKILFELATIDIESKTSRADKANCIDFVISTHLE